MDEAATRTAKGRWLRIEPGEGRALALAFGYFFFLLACYFVLRPVRDEFGARSGIKGLSWLFTGTFVATLLLTPLFGWLVARLKRRVFLLVIYGFLLADLIAFWSLLAAGVALGPTAITFFIWVSVFNIFAVSVFWSFMADSFTPDQAKRLYPLIAAGGSLGGFAGSAATAGLVALVGQANLLLIAAGLLALALACALGLKGEDRTREQAVGGNPFAGLTRVLIHPNLAGIALWVALLSLAGTFVYLMQAEIIRTASPSPEVRTRLFATVDLVVNIATPLIQVVLTGGVLRRVKVGVLAGVLPVVFAAGFAAVAAAPSLLAIMAFQAAQRIANFGLSNPARETLFTSVPREDKFKAKNVIDTVVFRGADVANTWLFNGLFAVLTLPAIALAAIPVMGGWLALSLALGRAHEKRGAAHDPV